MGSETTKQTLGTILNEPTHGYCMDPGTTKETLELLNAPWNLYMNPRTNN